ncbi:MAG: hypothetical protein Fur0036_00320 [Fimbriimonadaceae bacterium]
MNGRAALCFGVLAFWASFAGMCQPPSAGGQAPAEFSISDSRELGFDEFKETSATLVLAGTPIPVETKFVKEGEMRRLIFVVHGQEVDEERYRVGVNGLEFVGTRSETFEPAIPLAPLPFAAPRTSEWKGKWKTGPTEVEGEATIEATPERINTVGGQFDAARIEIKLTMKVDDKDRRERTLKFWLVRDHGIIRRELGADSAREPAAQKSP